MRLVTFSCAGLVVCLAMTLNAGCTDAGSGQDFDGPGIEVRVAPLTLSAVTNAEWRVTVSNSDPEVVWTGIIDAQRFGDGAGSLAYVVPCDADGGDNTVALELIDLYEGAGGSTLVPRAEYVNPGPVMQTLQCAANTDVLAEFNVTIARNANQGFFDVAINFDDLFCSAKFDCLDADGEALKLLHNGAQGRDTTLVMGLSCVGTAVEGDTTTILYYSPITVTCSDGSITLNPEAGPGNLDLDNPDHATVVGVNPLYAAAIYQGEPTASAEQRYWNVALGFVDGSLGCSVSAEATAAEGALVDGETPVNTNYPFIKWDVTISDGDTGALVCSQHPINGTSPNDGVSTEYTAASTPNTFSHSYPQGSAGCAKQGFVARGIIGSSSVVGADVGDPFEVRYAIDAGVPDLQANDGQGQYRSTIGSNGAEATLVFGAVEVSLTTFFDVIVFDESQDSGCPNGIDNYEWRANGADYQNTQLQVSRCGPSDMVTGEAQPLVPPVLAGVTALSSNFARLGILSCEEPVYTVCLAESHPFCEEEHCGTDNAQGVIDTFEFGCLDD